MVKRLTEQYKTGDLVEIYFVVDSSARRGDMWQPAQVIGLAHPGVWVQTRDGYQWFVTNGRKIRPATDHE